MWAAATLLLLAPSWGCAYGELRHVLRAEVASEMNCPEVTVERRAPSYLERKQRQFKIRGCGVVRSYTCPKFEDEVLEYGKTGCTYVDGDIDRPVMASMNPQEIEDPFEGGDDDGEGEADEELESSEDAEEEADELDEAEEEPSLDDE